MTSRSNPWCLLHPLQLVLAVSPRMCELVVAVCLEKERKSDEMYVE